MVLYAPDANTGADSSDASDANNEGSSSSQAGEEQQQGEGEADSHAEVADSGESADAATGDEQQADDQQDGQQGEGEGDAEGEAEVPLDKPEDAKLDFHKHERFQELIREKNEYKTQAEANKPLAERARMLDQYCQQNGISEQQIARALEYYRLLNNEPMKAYEMLRQDYQRLAMYAGDVLPDDLQAEVAAGTLSSERAKELAQARAQQQHQGWQSQSQEVSRQQQLIQAVDATINIWADAKMKQDPDLKPGSNLWKYLDSRIKNERVVAPGMSPQQANEMVDKLYKEAKEVFKPSARPPVKRTPKSFGSNNNNAGVLVKSPEDVARAIMRGVKPHQLKYS